MLCMFRFLRADIKESVVTYQTNPCANQMYFVDMYGRTNKTTQHPITNN